jgi:protein TonB
VSELLRALALPASADDFGPGDSIVIELPDASDLPSPQEFVPVEVQPALIELPAPVYPEMARMAGVEGTVVVRVLVGAKGNVLDAPVVEGHVMLKEAALSSARAATYRPALQQNHPIPVWVIQRITFKLD